MPLIGVKSRVSSPHRTIPPGRGAVCLTDGSAALQPMRGRLPWRRVVATLVEEPSGNGCGGGVKNDGDVLFIGCWGEQGRS